MFVPDLLKKGAGSFSSIIFVDRHHSEIWTLILALKKTMNLITNYERPRLDRFVKVVNVGLDDLCFSYFGRFLAACFSYRSSDF